MKGPVRKVQYSTVHCSTVQYSKVQYRIFQYSTVQSSTVQYSPVQYSTIKSGKVQSTTVQSSIRYSPVQYSSVYRPVQYSRFLGTFYTTLLSKCHCLFLISHALSIIHRAIFKIENILIFTSGNGAIEILFLIF